MPVDTARHVRLMLRNAPDAKPVVFGSVSTYGTLDDDETPATDESGQPITVRTWQVIVAAGSLPGLRDGSSITVGGVRYAVRGRPMTRENGDLVAFRVVR